MKYLTICYEYPPLGGGGSKVVAGLLKELVGKSNQIDLVTMWYRGLPFREESNQLRIFRIPCLRTNQFVCYMLEMPIYLLFAFPVLLFLTLKNKYKLNHTHFIFPDGVLALSLKIFTGLPYIITAHGSDVPGYNPDRFKLAHKVLVPIWKWIVEGANQIVCPSETIENLIKNISPNASTTIIPNGLDIEKFKPHREKKDSLLVVTRMFERKGIQYLLEALEHFNHGYEIHIVGDGPYLNILKEHVDDKNLDVLFWGFLDNQSNEIRDLYETSRIFVFPSESENFPIILLEAMAAGMAIITTKGTGCAEVVGDAALLVKPKDSVGIRDAIEKLKSDPELCVELGKKARDRLEKSFSWKKVAEDYYSLFQKVSNNKR